MFSKLLDKLPENMRLYLFVGGFILFACFAIYSFYDLFRRAGLWTIPILVFGYFLNQAYKRK